MKHFIINNKPDINNQIRFGGNDFHYLVRVRRYAPGECFPGLLPGNKKTILQVNSIDADMLTCTVLPDSISSPFETSRPIPGKPALILFQALPKGDKMDLIVRQAAEGGISQIIPFFSEFSIPHSKSFKKNSKRETLDIDPAKLNRWRRIVKEARQQSGSIIETQVLPIMQLNGVFDLWEKLNTSYPDKLGIVLHQTVQIANIPLEHGSLHSYLDNRPQLVAAAIGPEGGFSDNEINCFLEAGFKQLTIGDTVLRTETAAVYAAAAIRIILLERESWEMKRSY